MSRHSLPYIDKFTDCASSDYYYSSLWRRCEAMYQSPRLELCEPLRHVCGGVHEQVTFQHLYGEVRRTGFMLNAHKRLLHSDHM